MWILRGLLMKEQFQFPSFALTLKVCIVLILLMCTTSLACRGGGGGGGSGGGGGGGGGSGGGGGGGGDYGDSGAVTHYNQNTFKNYSDDDTLIVADLDEELVVNLTGIKDPVDRNINSAWRGWKPSEETQKEWKAWYENWLIENAKSGDVPWKPKKKKKGKGGAGGPDGNGDPGESGGDGRPGGQDFTAERGPGSGWPDLPGWSDLGAGSDGAPIPPWAYTPKNVGKPAICFLAPIKGTCTGADKDKKPEQRWGYNPYTDRCEKYEWSGCGGTRNKFSKLEKCEQHCALPPPPSCSADSGILDKSSKPWITN